MGMFVREFTGLDFLMTLFGLATWVTYLIKGENIVTAIFGKSWKKSFLRNFLVQFFFKGWLFFGGVILGSISDKFWLGIWKIALLLIVTFVIYTISSRKKKRKEKEAEEETEAEEATA